MLDIQTIQPKIYDLAQKHRLSLVMLFGSQVTGKTHLHSDVDMGFLSETNRGMTDESALEFDFMKMLGIPHLELVNMAPLPPLMLRNIVRSGVLLYERERSDYARFYLYAQKRYVETKPLIALREKQLANFVKTL